MAIPYATWANRGPGQMVVWLARTDAAAKPTPYPTVATAQTVTSSPAQRSARAINDGEEPTASDDPTSYFDWWPHRGTAEWVEYDVRDARDRLEGAGLLVRRHAHGEVRVPASWRLLYKDGGSWKPVETQDSFGVLTDRYNDVSFAPVTTSGLRLEVTLQAGWSAGLQEWKVQ